MKKRTRSETIKDDLIDRLVERPRSKAKTKEKPERLIEGKNRYDQIGSMEEVIKLVCMDGFDIKKIDDEMMFSSFNVAKASLMYLDCSLVFFEFLYGQWKLLTNDYFFLFKDLFETLENRFIEKSKKMIPFTIGKINGTPEEDISEGDIKMLNDIIIRVYESNGGVDGTSTKDFIKMCHAHNDGIENDRPVKYATMSKKIKSDYKSSGPFLAGESHDYKIELDKIYKFLVTENSESRKIAKECAVLFDSMGVNVPVIWADFIGETSRAHIYESRTTESAEALRIYDSIMYEFDDIIGFKIYPDEFVHYHYDNIFNSKAVVAILSNIYLNSLVNYFDKKDKVDLIKSKDMSEYLFEWLEDTIHARLNGMHLVMCSNDKTTKRLDEYIQFLMFVTRVDEVDEENMIKNRRNRVVFFMPEISYDNHIKLMGKMMKLFNTRSSIGKEMQFPILARYYPTIFNKIALHDNSNKTDLSEFKKKKKTNDSSKKAHDESVKIILNSRIELENYESDDDEYDNGLMETGGGNDKKTTKTKFTFGKSTNTVTYAHDIWISLTKTRKGLFDAKQDVTEFDYLLDLFVQNLGHDNMDAFIVQCDGLLKKDNDLSIDAKKCFVDGYRIQEGVFRNEQRKEDPGEIMLKDNTYLASSLKNGIVNMLPFPVEYRNMGKATGAVGLIPTNIIKDSLTGGPSASVPKKAMNLSTPVSFVKKKYLELKNDTSKMEIGDALLKQYDYFKSYKSEHRNNTPWIGCITGSIYELVKQYEKPNPMTRANSIMKDTTEQSERFSTLNDKMSHMTSPLQQAMIQGTDITDYEDDLFNNPMIRTVMMGDLFINIQEDRWTSSANIKDEKLKETGISSVFIHDHQKLKFKNPGNRDENKKLTTYWNLMELQKRALFTFDQNNADHISAFDYLMLDPSCLWYFMTNHFMNMALESFKPEKLELYRHLIAFGCLLYTPNLEALIDQEYYLGTMTEKERLSDSSLSPIAQKNLSLYDRLFKYGIAHHINNTISTAITGGDKSNVNYNEIIYGKLFYKLVLTSLDVSSDYTKVSQLYHVVRNLEVNYDNIDSRLESYNYPIGNLIPMRIQDDYIGKIHFERRRTFLNTNGWILNHLTGITTLQKASKDSANDNEQMYIESSSSTSPSSMDIIAYAKKLLYDNEKKIKRSMNINGSCKTVTTEIDHIKSINATMNKIMDSLKSESRATTYPQKNELGDFVKKTKSSSEKWVQLWKDILYRELQKSLKDMKNAKHLVDIMSDEFIDYALALETDKKDEDYGYFISYIKYVSIFHCQTRISKLFDGDFGEYKSYVSSVFGNKDYFSIEHFGRNWYKIDKINLYLRSYIPWRMFESLGKVEESMELMTSFITLILTSEEKEAKSTNGSICDGFFTKFRLDGLSLFEWIKDKPKMLEYISSMDPFSLRMHFIDFQCGGDASKARVMDDEYAMQLIIRHPTMIQHVYIDNGVNHPLSSDFMIKLFSKMTTNSLKYDTLGLMLGMFYRNASRRTQKLYVHNLDASVLIDVFGDTAGSYDSDMTIMNYLFEKNSDDGVEDYMDIRNPNTRRGVLGYIRIIMSRTNGLNDTIDSKFGWISRESKIAIKQRMLHFFMKIIITNNNISINDGLEMHNDNLSYFMKIIGSAPPEYRKEKKEEFFEYYTSPSKKIIDGVEYRDTPMVWNNDKYYVNNNSFDYYPFEVNQKMTMNSNSDNLKKKMQHPREKTPNDDVALDRFIVQ